MIGKLKPWGGAFLVAVIIALATPASGAARPTKSKAARQGEKSLVAKPIEPMTPREEKPRAGWNGLYGGLNAGGGFSDQ